MTKFECLVVDTGAFVKEVPLWEYGENLFTVADVIKEIRDKQTRQRIHSLPVEVQIREPSPNSITFVSEFSKKTGDYAGLSLADIKIIALAYELEVEKSGRSDHLRTEPSKSSAPSVVCYKPSNLFKENIEGFYLPSKKIQTAASDGQSSSTNTELVTAVNTSNLQIYATNLNFLLADRSYVSGFLATEEDASTLDAILRMINNERAKLEPKHFDLSISDKFADLSTKLSDAFHKSPNGVSLTPENIVRFSETVCDLPHFCRWFLHILSFKEQDWHLIQKSQNGEATKELDDIDEEASCPTNPSADEQEDPLSTFAAQMQKGLSCLSPQQDAGDSSSTFEQQERDSGCSSDESNLDGKGSTNDDEDEEEDSDDEGWITPSNIQQFKRLDHNQEEEEIIQDMKTACITLDFSLQNVLKHIGLQVIGVDGRVIKKVRTYILRCYACFKTTARMNLVFCPHCGHKTLKKVSFCINPDGTRKLFISTRKPIIAKNHSIPLPKGGKHANNPILVADQRIPQQRPSNLGRMKTNVFSDSYEAGFSPFVTRDVYSRSAQLGITSSRIDRSSADRRNQPGSASRRKKRRR